MKLLIFLIFTYSLHAITLTENTTLTQDLVYDENLTVSGANINLNGHTLTVNGSLTFSGDNSRLQMQKTDDKLIVQGDLSFGGASTYELLTAGVIELQGNFYQIGTRIGYSNDYSSGRYRDYSNNAYSFYPSGSHKVIFKGTTTQTVNMQASSYSRFANVEIQNSAGVVFDQVNITSFTRNNNPVTMTDIRRFTLEEDMIIPNDVTVMADWLTLNGFNLKVEGDLTLNTGSVNIDSGILTVTNNMVLSGDNSRLQMQKTDDKLVVLGDLSFGGASTYELLTAGVIELQGNFYQIGTRIGYSNDYSSGRYRDYSNNAYSFYPSGSHKVIFKGTTTQTVNMQASSYSRFANLEILNEDIVFNQTTNVVDTLYTSGALYNEMYKNSDTLTHVNYLNSDYNYFVVTEGINFISLPNANDLNISTIATAFNSNVSTVWTYDKGWSGYSNLLDRQEKLAEHNLSTISDINAGEGIIIHSLTEQTLKFPKGDSYSIKDLSIVENLSIGWHLLGTNRSVSVADIQALNSNIVSFWAYNAAEWLATADEGEFLHSIEKREISILETIPSNSAFWVYVK